MLQFVRKKRRSPVINIISMIDVLVVLLIFYIVTTVFKKDQPIVKIKPPSSTQAAETQDLPPEIIYLTADRKVFLQSEPVDIDKLGSVLKQKMTLNPQYKVALKADTDAPFGAITKIMDAAHTAGIANLDTFMNKADATAPAGANP